MKNIFLLGLFISLLSCTSVSNVPEEEKAKRKKDSIAMAKALLPEAEKRRIFKEVVRWPEELDASKHITFERFYKEYYPHDSLQYTNYNSLTEFYYSANEELINPRKIDNRKWFRLFVIPSFESAFCITLEKNKYYYNLTYKQFKEISSERPNNEVFSLTHTTRDPLIYNAFFDMLNKKGFLERNPSYPNCNFHDPILFVSEEIIDNKYNKVESALPWHSQCASDDDYYIIIEAMKLVKNSEIYPVFKNAFLQDKEEDWLNPYEFFESILNTPRQSPTE